MISSPRIPAVPAHRIDTERKLLDVVVPFTTPELTQNALDEADKLAGQLNGRIRVIAIQTVHIALPLDHPPVSSDHLEGRIRKLLSRAPAHGEIYLVRDPEQTWAKLLRARSLIAIASRKRPWRTREERLARMLERNGHEVVLSYPRKLACSI